MPFGFLLIQSVIFRIFQAPKVSLVQAAPGGETSDSATVGGQAATANVPTGRVRVSGVGEFLVVSFFRSYLLKVWFFLKKRKEAIPTIFSLFWNSPNFFGRSSESSTAATARRWAWKIQNRRVWLIHSSFHICFTNFVGALKTSHETTKDFWEKLLFSSMLVKML